MGYSSETPLLGRGGEFNLGTGLRRRTSLFRAAKTNRRGTEVRIAEVPGIYRVVIGRPANGIRRRVEPTGASNISIFSGLWPLWIRLRHERVVIDVIPVIDPLADVSDHVVETITVGLVGPNWLRVSAIEVCRHGIGGGASGRLWRLDVLFTGIDIIGVSPRVVIPVESASRRFLPLGFRWQTFAGPLAVGSRFEPVNIVNG